MNWRGLKLWFARIHHANYPSLGHPLAREQTPRPLGSIQKNSRFSSWHWGFNKGCSCMGMFLLVAEIETAITSYFVGNMRNHSRLVHETQCHPYHFIVAFKVNFEPCFCGYRWRNYNRILHEDPWRTCTEISCPCLDIAVYCMFLLLFGYRVVECHKTNPIVCWCRGCCEGRRSWRRDPQNVLSWANLSSLLCL